jgi:hypothetical protein
VALNSTAKQFVNAPIRLAEKLPLTTPREARELTRAVTPTTPREGHELTRAVKPLKCVRALAPEVRRSRLRRLFQQTGKQLPEKQFIRPVNEDTYAFARAIPGARRRHPRLCPGTTWWSVPGHSSARLPGVSFSAR